MGRGGTRISARELKLEVDYYKEIIRKKNERINEINDILMGRLDKKTIEMLEKLRKNK